MLTMATMLLSVSCSKDDTADADKKATVSFDITTSELVTRAYGDGKKALLMYAVYDETANSTVVEGVSKLEPGSGPEFNDNLTTTVNLSLLSGNKYSILFWATSANYDDAYAINWKEKKVEMNPVIPGNTEAFDSFFHYEPEFTVNGSISKPITLVRPFAQLNIGTNDKTQAEAANLKVSNTKVVVKNVPMTLDVTTGSVDNEHVIDITYEYGAVPNDVNNKFPVDGYSYLAMNYVLVGTDKIFSDIEFSYKGSSKEFTNIYPSIPLQRNHRTNVYGSILTSSADYGVEIKPGFGENDDQEHNYENKKVNDATEFKEALNDPNVAISLTNDIVLSETITISKDFSLISNDKTISCTAGAVFAVADGANVNIEIKDTANFTGSTNGITVPANSTLTIKGSGNLIVEGTAGSGIGVADSGTINIVGLDNITAKGNGSHAFGIGGNGANVLIKNSVVDYACGGHIQPSFVNDTKYGKSEPEGGAAIGGATIEIIDATITKVDGGSKAAGIGAQYWQSTDIVIINSTISEANGGNASAGIGGSRYAEESKYNLSIKIKNSTVTATGGQRGAGIGSGYDVHCNGNNYTATNNIEIDANSTIVANGGEYAAGIGTGFHSAYLSGSIASGANITATSGEKKYKDEYSLAQHIGYGVVDPAREFSGNNANITFKVNGNLIASPWISAQIGSTGYPSFAAAVAAAKAGDIITLTGDVTLSEALTLPADITLNGNGKQINGTIYAGGDLTIAGHTKVTSFSASYYNRTITIGEGACLEITGTDRTSLAYGNTFNITGSITDAKSTDKTTIQPSLIIPDGISITGGNNAILNITNAYVQIGSTTSKNISANCVFDINITNSIAEFTNQFTLSEPTNGNTPTFNLKVKNSVVTTATKMCIAAPNSNIEFDNSTITLGTYLRNSGTITLKNGSALNGSTIQFGENGGNNGTINVDASTLNIEATSTGHAFDGKNTGSIKLTNNASASVTYYKDMTISKDDTSTFTGTEVE